MRDDLFKELITSVEQAGLIRRGEKPAARVSVFKGDTLFEVSEQGMVVWPRQPIIEERGAAHPN